MATDVTNQMKYEPVSDEELLSITQCVCGKEFKPWEFTVSVYRDNPSTCPHCGRTFTFSVKVTIYQENDDGDLIT